MNDTIIEPKFKYIKSFDSLRGFAALLVLMLHFSYGFLKGGWIGVDLFFVLSGYLITSILKNEYLVNQSVSLSKFYVRRALRLFPPMIICVLLANILWSSTKICADGNRLLATFAALFYFTNLIDRTLNNTGNLVHLWSLSVEEHFYIFWPLLASLFLFKKSQRTQVMCVLLLIFITIAFKIFVFHKEDQLVYGFFRIDPYIFTFCKMDSILMGALLSFILSTPNNSPDNNDRQKNTLLILFCIGCFVILLFTLRPNQFWNNGGFILTNLLCTFTVFMAVRNPNHYLLTNKVLCWIGKRSYGIYLYHYPIYSALERFRHANSLSNLLLVTFFRFAISFIFAALSYKYIELPILKLKKRYEPRISNINKTNTNI